MPRDEVLDAARGIAGDEGRAGDDRSAGPELAGLPSASAGPGARGFIGMAFRVRDGKFEYIYLRPTNGRADDQVRRNHSTQYSSFPDFDFARLRRATLSTVG